MQAAFAAGARVVELDIHRTTDNQLAVFHDWQVDCRTNGQGNTASYSMAQLKNLDIGWGYTADGGMSYPFRGYKEAMPSLTEVFQSVEGEFLVNIKSSHTREAEALIRLLKKNPEFAEKIWSVYGAEIPIHYLQKHLPQISSFTKKENKYCLLSHLLTGWFNYASPMCQNTIIAVPSNYTAYIWGWPHRFTQLMKHNNTQVIAMGPRNKAATSEGIDKMSELKPLENFSGYIWTNKAQNLTEVFKP
nr:glycerophosphodiester phosphodiesterase family protein [Pseudovibrio stylochi]